VASIAEGDDREHQHFLLTWSDGDTESREGSLAEASELARSSGLRLVPTIDDSILWRRDLGPGPHQ